MTSKKLTVAVDISAMYWIVGCWLLRMWTMFLASSRLPGRIQKMSSIYLSQRSGFIGSWLMSFCSRCPVNRFA